MDFGAFCGTLWRKKTVVTSTLLDTKLKRCLGLLDLIGFGLGSTLGLGVYVVTSYAISYEAGPSYVLSVIIAGVAALFAGLCYAEFSARLPRSGSAYMYSYVTLGELWGFVIGWNMILEYVLSAALAAKAWSQYLDFMLNGTIKQFFIDNTDYTGGGIMCDQPDVVAFAVLLVVTIVTAMGVKASSVVNLVLVFFNLLIIMCFVCIGYFHVKHENWTDPPGFFAHGFSGILQGAGSLMFAFAGVEVVTCCSEEAREPARTVPSAILYTVFTSAAVYFGVSTAATLSLHEFHVAEAVALPKVLQTLPIHGASSVIVIGGLLGLAAAVIGALVYLPRILRLRCQKFSHIHGASSVIVIGGLLGLAAAVIGALVYLPRILYAMSCDQLLFQLFSKAVALPKVLQTLHIHGASSVIVIGGLLGLAAAVIGALVYLPRILYAMSCDQLLFQLFSKVVDKTNVPVYSVLVSGGFSSIVALFFKFEVLLEIVSLGTLLAYTSVAICVVCMRYQQETVGLYIEYEDPNDADFLACTDFTYADFPLDASKSLNSSYHSHSKQQSNGHAKLYHERSKLTNGYSQLKTPLKRTMSLDDASKLASRNSDDPTRPRDSTYRRMESVISSTSAGSVSGLFRLPSDTVLEPTEGTWKKCAIGLIVFLISSVLLCIVTLYLESVLQLNSWWLLSVVAIFAVIMIASVVLIARQPQNNAKLYFLTPYVPCVPLVSILINTALLVSLPQTCWLRFLIWMVTGLVLYFAYSRLHSSERRIDEQEVVLYEITDDSNPNST